MKGFIAFLSEPSLKKFDVDGIERIELHSKVLETKQMLKEVFVEFHHSFHELAARHIPAKGLEVELGAGVAPMRDTYRQVLATDIVAAPYLDQVVDAQNMELDDAGVAVFYGQNCFHHFPEPDLFFNEVKRTLKPGGGLILIEPYYGPLASTLYKRMFKSEGFDKAYGSWNTPATGPMNGANQALSFLVFIRDKEEFDRKHPSLEIVHQEVCNNYLRYLISGGLNFRQLLPNFCTPLIKLLEKILQPLNTLLGLHHIIVIRKKPA
ncbi:methyltransferase domain-containing protein [Pseudomonas sp. 43A]|jgi:SAM-dependent methyltransferase|uniref:class I SAM-dependent methyltransferase n=1 Tax=Pseudomonas TaxID=286 RepID=UPI00035EC345|nr:MULTISPECIES: methyltransferase domain-containing protein [Pseudomonas]QKV63224.1 methyltransferase domain-containing protein [Pseudomonas sp. 43A]QMW08636.1 methyltransferase domain-containing protein [Pseudomonas sp. 29A]